MFGHGELGGHPVTVECPELTGGEPQRLGLQGHVGDGLAEVVERELRVLPVGALHVAVCQIGDQQAGARRPGRRATGQVGDETLMSGVSTSADDERTRL